MTKNDGHLEEINKNCIAEKDFPKCKSGPYRKSMKINKVNITFPHLQRKYIFYEKWNKEEIKTFEKLYLRLSRSGDRRHIFETIANNLPNKTIAECIEYYYLFKNIRSFEAKSKARKRKKRRKQQLDNLLNKHKKKDP